MTDEAGCLICGAVQEMNLHALRDYRFVTKAWLKIISKDCAPRIFGLDLFEWVSDNLRGEFRMGSGGAEAQVIFSVLC